MQAWFYAFQIINEDRTVSFQGDGTFGSNRTDTHELVEEQRAIVASKASVMPENVLFTAFNKL
jgi:hypothetical protein